MTHNTVSLDPENYGSQDAYLHTINITSLDAAGTETYDPDAELSVNLGDDYGVWAVGQENESVIYAWSHTDTNLSVKHNGASGTAGADVANNSALDEVRLLVVGGGT